jgi:hypothetical protein
MRPVRGPTLHQRNSISETGLNPRTRLRNRSRRPLDEQAGSHHDLHHGHLRPNPLSSKKDNAPTVLEPFDVVKCNLTECALSVLSQTQLVFSITPIDFFARLRVSPEIAATVEFRRTEIKVNQFRQLSGATNGH